MAGKVFVTGDTHGRVERFSSKNWPEGKTLDRDDYVIVLGDCGLVWHNYPNTEEVYWTDWLDNKPWTTLFVDGNHENHPRLLGLPEYNKFGGKVGKLKENIFHLKRGHVFRIHKKTFFAMGGAYSIDKGSRQDGISWWKEEIPSYKELDRGLENLERHNNKVDFIIAHTGPSSICDEYMDFIDARRYGDEISAKINVVEKYFERLIEIVEFDGFYFGHWHDQWDFNKYHILYEDIKQIV